MRRPHTGSHRAHRKQLWGPVKEGPASLRCTHKKSHILRIVRGQILAASPAAGGIGEMEEKGRTRGPRQRSRQHLADGGSSGRLQASFSNSGAETKEQPERPEGYGLSLSPRSPRKTVWFIPVAHCGVTNTFWKLPSCVLGVGVLWGQGRHGLHLHWKMEFNRQ